MYTGTLILTFEPVQRKFFCSAETEKFQNALSRHWFPEQDGIMRLMHCDFLDAVSAKLRVTFASLRSKTPHAMPCALYAFMYACACVLQHVDPFARKRAANFLFA